MFKNNSYNNCFVEKSSKYYGHRFDHFSIRIESFGHVHGKVIMNDGLDSLIFHDQVMNENKTLREIIERLEERIKKLEEYKIVLDYCSGLRDAQMLDFELKLKNELIL